MAGVARNGHGAAMAAQSPPGSGLSRRQLCRAGALAAAGLALDRGHVAKAGQNWGLAADGVSPALRRRALDALAEHNRSIWSRDVIAIADFALPSAVPRLFLIDLLAGGTTGLLVAHGRGSDPAQTGQLQAFSNAVGSGATSEGAYLIGEAYQGVHGASRRLIGLDPSNSNAEARAIVIHSAWYVGPQMLARWGKLGRSDGCFAVSADDIGPLLARLGRGRLLYAGKG